MVIEGPKAGGHLGFAREELEKITDTEYEKEIQGIMEVSKEYGTKYGYQIPVVVAGGIYDGKDMEPHMSAMPVTNINRHTLMQKSKILFWYKVQWECRDGQ